MNEHGTVENFITEQLGTVSMDMSKQKFINRLQQLGYNYSETPRTVTVKLGENTEVYIIFSEEQDRIILVDLCNVEIKSITIDSKVLTPESIKNDKETPRVNYVKCSKLGDWVELTKSLECKCSTASETPREYCKYAWQMLHELYYGYSIVSYTDLGNNDDTLMFCIENNNGQSIQFEEIREQEESNNQ